MGFELRLDTLPAKLVAAIESNLGPTDTLAFLSKSVETANNLAQSWSITIEEVLTGGVMSLCVRGSDLAGNQVVLKVPANKESGHCEIAALRSWSEGAPKLIAHDEETAAFLMEFIQSIDAIIDADELFRLADRLHQNVPETDYEFPNLSVIIDIRIQWAEERFSMERYSEHCKDLETAKSIIKQLLNSTTEVALLHGDLQRKNLLVSSDGLHAIDPLACIGDPVFDSAFWLALVHHDRPLKDILFQYSEGRSAEEYQRFFCWVWALSVIENRPWEEFGTEERQQFIDEFRDSVIEEARLLEFRVATDLDSKLQLSLELTGENFSQF